MVFSLDCLKNYHKHSIQILQHLMIPKPQNAIPPLIKESSTFRIIHRLLKMLSTINLDDQFFLRRAEINDVWSNGMLSSKTGILQLAHPQRLPQPHFSIRHIAA